MKRQNIKRRPTKRTLQTRKKAWAPTELPAITFHAVVVVVVVVFLYIIIIIIIIIILWWRQRLSSHIVLALWIVNRLRSGDIDVVFNAKSWLLIRDQTVGIVIERCTRTKLLQVEYITFFSSFLQHNGILNDDKPGAFLRSSSSSLGWCSLFLSPLSLLWIFLFPFTLSLSLSLCVFRA